MPGPLADVARNDDGIGLELGGKELDLLQLVELGIHPEMHVGEVENPDAAHQMTRTR